MRKALVLLLLGTVAGCGGGNDSRQPTQTSSADLHTVDSAEERAPGAPPPPSVAPTAAPGVAFNYRYAFRLAGERIGPVQEQHAAACEKLGILRCRITGMRYRLVGDDDIEAMLAFKLDPAIARAFGRQGQDVVNRAQGMLVDAEITGEDVGSQIAAATRTEGELAEDLKRIEAQLARSGLGPAERAQLQSQAQQIRDQIRATRTTRGEQEKSLATTPIVFEYGSGDVAVGYDGRSKLARAGQRAVDNLVGGGMFILVALITLLPWLLLIGLGIWAFRRLRASATRLLGVSPALPPEA